MSKIRIKNFGPIKQGLSETLEDGTYNEWIDIKNVTIFIGNQGSGKSTLAKAISTMTWIEKALTRGDLKIETLKESIPNPGTRKKTPWSYHRLDNYFSDDLSTEISYLGDSFYISFSNGSWDIREVDNGSYLLPQVMYVPAERNFISYALRSIPNVSDSLTEFLTVYNRAKQDIKSPLKLPINETFINYDRLNDKINIEGDNYKLQIGEASSGFQSIVPLYVVSKYLAESISDEDRAKSNKMQIEQRQRFTKEINIILESTSLTDEQKQIAISELTKKFNKSVFINIVEEPEQNLFPSSQGHILYSLLEFNNMNVGNKLIMTTHSPYLLNYVSVAVKAYELSIRLKTEDQKIRLDAIVPIRSAVNSSGLVIYEFDETDGSIRRLGNFEGIPSDRNFLNDMLAQNNQMFDALLEIEEEL